MTGNANQPYTVRCPDAAHDPIPASSRENAVIIGDAHRVKHGHESTIEYDEPEVSGDE
jgi:hypothetical protein